MFSISGINRRIRKERIWLTVGAAVLILVLLISAAAGFLAVQNRERSILKSHVSYAIRTMADRFEDMIVSGVSQLKIASMNTDFDVLERSVVEIAGSDIFDGAVLLDERSKAVTRSGSVPETMGNFKVIRYPYKNVIAYIYVQNNGMISIKLDTNAKYDIQAWVRGEYIDEIFTDKGGEQFDYCLFDASTGAYIINRTSFTENSYFDTLLARNENGRMEPLLNTWKASGAQTLVSSGSVNGEDDYYIAQARTGIGDITAAVTIPLSRLRGDLKLQGWNNIVVVGALGAAVLFVLLATLLVFRHENRVEEFTERSSRISDMLLHRASNGAKITLMLYDSASDTFCTYCESDKDRKQFGDADPRNLREFAVRYHIADEDIERMYAACRALKRDESTSLNVTSVRDDGDRSMHLHMHAAEDGGLVVCSMYDCTNELRANERLQQENAFRNSVLPRCMSCWEINVTANSWKATYCARNANSYMLKLAEKAVTPRDYGIDLANIVRTVVHPDDCQSYMSAVNPDALASMYHSGIVENAHEYRVRSEQKGGYEWHRQIIHMQKSMDSDDIIATLYILNINAERMAETERRERSRILQQSLTALGGLYFALFYVDLDNDICYTAKAPKGEIVSQVSGPYKATFDAYIDSSIHPDDRERIRGALSAYALRRQMTESDHLVCGVYRRKVDDAYKDVTLLIQAARFENGTVRDVVIALRDMDKTKQ